MPIIPGTIVINWVSQYAGAHRVCYRLQGTIPYTCTNSGTHPNCGGGGAPCSYNIPINVDNETCETITYEGYVQAACEDEASLNGRIPFSVAFIPSPSCKKWTATCNTVSVGAANLVGGGSGYDPLNLPNVNFTGGSGIGATAIVTVSNNSVLGINAVAPAGAGYTDGVYTNHPTIGGSGTGLTMDFTVVGGIVTSFDGSNTIANGGTGGSGYTTSDIIQPDPAGPAGSPSTAYNFTVQLVSTGVVTSITLTNGGSGYTTIPNIIIDSPSSGTIATANAVLSYCASIDLHDCTTVGPESHDFIAVGESIDLCNSVEPPIDASYTVIENGNCLCDCTEMTFENTGATGDITITYVNCGGIQGTLIIGPGLVSLNTCLVTNSWTSDDPKVNAVIVGPCSI